MKFFDRTITGSLGEPETVRSVSGGFAVNAIPRSRVRGPGLQGTATRVAHGGIVCRRNGGRDCGAFTLIEILVAVGIFAIVLLAIHGVFFGALHLRAKTVQATDDLLPVDLAVAIMKRDLANIVPPGGGVQASMLVGSMNSGNSAGLIKGPEISLTQPIALEIFSANGVLSDDFPWGDVQKVDYLLQDPTNRSSALGKDLVRSATRNLLATGVNEADQRSLLADVEGLQFSFYDGTNWLDIWDSTVNTAMPTAVKVLVQRVSGDLENKIITPVEFVVPVVTQARTNSGAGGAG